MAGASQESGVKHKGNIATLFPKIKICKLRYEFSSRSGSEERTDKEHIFVEQLEKERRLEQMKTDLSKTTYLSFTDADMGVVSAKFKESTPLKDSKKWMKEVRNVVYNINKIYSDFFETGQLSEKILQDLTSTYPEVKASCYLSYDKQSLLVTSSDDEEVQEIKRFVESRMPEANVMQTKQPSVQPLRVSEKKSPVIKRTTVSISPESQKESDQRSPVAKTSGATGCSKSEDIPDKKSPSTADMDSSSTARNKYGTKSPGNKTTGSRCSKGDDEFDEKLPKTKLVATSGSPQDEDMSGEKSNIRPPDMSTSFTDERKSENKLPVSSQEVMSASGEVDLSPQSHTQVSVVTADGQASARFYAEFNQSVDKDLKPTVAQPPTTMKRTVEVSEQFVRLLQGQHVRQDFFRELENSGVEIDEDSVASGHIVVTQGDREKVIKALQRVINTLDLADRVKDKDVSQALCSLRKQFPDQVELDESSLRIIFHTKVEAEVKAEVEIAVCRPESISLSLEEMNYIQHHLSSIRQSASNGQVNLNVEEGDGIKGVLVISPPPANIRAVKSMIEEMIANLYRKKENIELSEALFLNGVKGQMKVEELERRNGCLISVFSPSHQVLMRVKSVSGCRLILCEGSMAASDCDVVVFPLTESQKEWPLSQRLILEKGLLASSTEPYKLLCGASPKSSILRAQCQGFGAGQMVVMVRVQHDLTAVGGSTVADGLREALTSSLVSEVSVAVPVSADDALTLAHNLTMLLQTIDQLDREDEKVSNATVVLYLENISDAERREAAKTVENFLKQPQWCVETDVVAVYGETDKSSPSLVISGLQKDVEKAFTELKSMQVSDKYKVHARMIATVSSMTRPQAVKHLTSAAEAIDKDFTTKSGIRVSVYKTDITKLVVDVIVNAANGRLMHGGGVAAAIARAAGRALDEEGRIFVERFGPLDVSEVLPTTSGNLPCKIVFHAVGPCWYDYPNKEKCARDLQQTVFNCLKKAHSLKFTSIAVSSISSAIFGVPEDVCAQMYLRAVQQFEHKHGGETQVQHIHFVDVRDGMVSVIRDTFSRQWNSDTLSPSGVEGNTQNPSRREHNEDTQDSRRRGFSDNQDLGRQQYYKDSQVPSRRDYDDTQDREENYKSIQNSNRQEYNYDSRTVSRQESNIGSQEYSRNNEDYNRGSSGTSNQKHGRDSEDYGKGSQKHGRSFQEHSGVYQDYGMGSQGCVRGFQEQNQGASRQASNTDAQESRSREQKTQQFTDPRGSVMRDQKSAQDRSSGGDDQPSLQQKGRGGGGKGGGQGHKDSQKRNKKKGK